MCILLTLQVELRDGCGNMAHIILCEFSTLKTKIIALLTYTMELEFNDSAFQLFEDITEHLISTYKQSSICCSYAQVMDLSIIFNNTTN